MEPLASVTDLEIRLGRTFESSEVARALALLEDASELVRDVAGGKTWVDDTTGELQKVPGSVRWVVLRAAERAVRNPEGYSAESAGDYSFQRTGVQPGIYLTEGEEKAVRRALGKSGLWNQPVTRNEEVYQTVWLNDQFGTEPIPYDIYRA